MVKEGEERAPPQDRPAPDPPGELPQPSPQPSDDEDDQPRRQVPEQVPQPEPQDDIDAIVRNYDNRLNELNIPEEDLMLVACDDIYNMYSIILHIISVCYNSCGNYYYLYPIIPVLLSDRSNDEMIAILVMIMLFCLVPTFLALDYSKWPTYKSTKRLISSKIMMKKVINIAILCIVLLGWKEYSPRCGICKVQREPIDTQLAGNNLKDPSTLTFDRDIVLYNVRENTDTSKTTTTTTTEEDEPKCIELKQPALAFELEEPLKEEKSLVELKCIGSSSYRRPEITKDMQAVLDVNTNGLIPKLIGRGLILKWSKRLFSKELKKDARGMCDANNNGVYFNVSQKKCGMGRRSCTTQQTRYPNDDVKLIVDVDKFDDSDIQMCREHLKELYDAIPSYDKDYSDMTHDDLQAYRNKYGITPYLKIFFNRVLNHGGDKVQGTMKVIISELIESAVQEYWKENKDGSDNGDDEPTCRSKYSIHEWLHYDCGSAQHTFERVEEFLPKAYEPSMSEFYKKPTNMMTYIEKIASLSWEPRHTMRQEKLHLRPTDEDIMKVMDKFIKSELVYDDDEKIKNDLDGIAVRTEEAFGVELSRQEVSTIVNGNNEQIVSMLKDKITSLDEPTEGEAVIIHVTHGLYDRYFMIWGSKEKGYWEDPIPYEEGSLVWKWNAATGLTPNERSSSRVHIKSAVMAMMELHGPQADAESNTPSKLVDLCYECFRDATEEEKFHQMMLRLKFQQVGVKFGELTFYGFRNIYCQPSTVVAHRPFSSALKSRPPYEPAFSEQEWRDHYHSSSEYCVAQTIRNYQRDPSKGYQVDKSSTSLPVIFEYKSYLNQRWHLEYQGTVKFCKDLWLLDHPDIDPLSCKYGLCTKYINKHTRELAQSSGSIRRDFFVGWKVTNILSWYLDNIDEAARLIHDNLLKTDLNGSSRPYFKQLALMVTARKKYFRNNSKTYKQILTVIEAGINKMKIERQAEANTKRVATNEMTVFNKHWPKIQQYARDERNYETLEDGERVFVVPRRSESYKYLSNLRRADNDDWRLKILRDAGMDMDRYEEAQEKRKQDFAQPYDEAAKKARSNNGHADDEYEDYMKGF